MPGDYTASPSHSSSKMLARPARRQVFTSENDRLRAENNALRAGAPLSTME